MDLFYLLLLLLIATRACGELAERVKQPSLVGELIAGIALGVLITEYYHHIPYAYLLPDLNTLIHNEVFVTITDLGMFFLMLYAGVEMQPHKVFQHSATSLAVALGGMVLPLGLGIALGLAFLPDTPMRPALCLFIGTALAITAVPATVRILMDLGQLDSRVGQTIVTAAIFDDILSLLLLAWLTGLIGEGEPPGLAEFALLSAKILVFFAVTAVIGLFVFPWGGKFMHLFKAHELELSAVLVGAFAFSILAELLGLHFIVGAFIAGLYFGQKTIDEESYDRVHDTISAMTFGFLAPIFFASIGFNLTFRAFSEAPLFLVLLVLTAFVGKVLGSGLAARVSGFTTRESSAIGIGMSPRGAVELVIAGIALKAGLFTVTTGEAGIIPHLFSAVVIMSVITTVISPIILRYVFEKQAKP